MCNQFWKEPWIKYFFCQHFNSGIIQMQVIYWFVFMLTQFGSAEKIICTHMIKGLYMLMTVLKGPLAVKQSKALIRTFKKMKDYILGIWRGNPRPFNDRDESAACFYHAINLPKAWSFLCSKKRNCLRQRNIGKIRVAVYRENNTVCIIYFNCLLTICILYDIIYVEKIT